MKIYRSLTELGENFGPSAVMIGKFDGVHAGHRAVIETGLEIAQTHNLASVVITFDRHPLSLLRPEEQPETLVGTDQKLQLLAETGVDVVLLLPFDEKLSRLEPDEFVRKVLVDALDAKVVSVGPDFRYGHGGRGDVSSLRISGEQCGFAVVVHDFVQAAGTRPVSSTWIRELLAEGSVDEASELLTHQPTIRAVVVHGAKRGRDLGFPTANLSTEVDGLIPADGVYAGWLVDAGVRYPAAISVGNNPTFDGVPAKQVEAYILDATIDLYGHTVDLSFVDRIRGMVAFEGIEPLIAQMNDDVEQTRRILGVGPAQASTTPSSEAADSD